MNIAQVNDTAELFRRIREENNLSQTQLAERINASGSYLSNIEKGKSVAGKNILKRLADAFSIDLEECMALIRGEETKEGKTKKPERKAVETKKEKNVIDLEERKNMVKEKKGIDFSKINSAAKLFSSVREANGYTITKMKKELGSSTSYISQIENGKKLPGKNMVLRLAETFELPIEKCLEVSGFTSKDSTPGSSTKTELERTLNQKVSSEENKVKEPKVVVNVSKGTDGSLDNAAAVTNVKEVNTKMDETLTKVVKSSKEEKDISMEKSLDEMPGSITEDNVESVIPEFFTGDKVEKMNYNIVAIGSCHLVKGKKYTTDLTSILENIKNHSYRYELLFSIDGEEKNIVSLSIANNELIVSLEKQAN